MTWCMYLQSFEKNISMSFRVTVRKLTVTDGRTDGRTGVLLYLPSRASGAAGDNEVPILLSGWLHLNLLHRADTPESRVCIDDTRSFI